MLLVILGAGASYDSISGIQDAATDLYRDYGARPPMADNLFAPTKEYREVLNRLPQAKQLATALHSRPKGMSLEDVLAEFADEEGIVTGRREQLTAVRFYIQEVICRSEIGWYRRNNEATNTIALLDELTRRGGTSENVAFVTFNYDRLIEYAFETNGRTFNDFDSYVNSSEQNVFKLHGSVDWWWQMQAQSTAEIDFSDSLNFARSMSTHIQHFKRVGLSHQAGKSHPFAHRIHAIPAISIPVKVKSDFECPAEHLIQLTEILPKVRGILSIGWRGAEKHFLQLLTKHIRRQIVLFSVCGGKNGLADCEEMSCPGFRGHLLKVFTLGSEVAYEAYTAPVYGRV